MSLGYKQIFANELNNNSQIRRSTDMAYQRGATYEIVLTGDSYYTSMELDVDIYVDDDRKGRLTVVPYSIEEDNSIYTYIFNVRPYNYLTNFLETEHHQHLWLHDWDRTNVDVNTNNLYRNIIKFNLKFGYKYVVDGGVVKEYEDVPTNDFDHYTSLPLGFDDANTASGFTNTGEYFHLIGGAFQLDDKYLSRNIDQEVGSTISGETLNTLDTERATSPITQYLMDYPTVPQESETGRFLTDSPRIQYVQETENHSLYFLNGMTGDRQFTETSIFYIEFYDENNNRLDYTYNRVYIDDLPTGYTTDLTVTTIPCGPADLTTLYETLDLTDVAYYTLQVCGSDNEMIEPLYPVSEVFYFYLTENCKPEDTRITYLNARGGFDYFTFTAYREDTKKISRETFDNRYYATNIEANDRNVGRTVKQFEANVEQEFILETDYLTESEGNALEQLFYSPQAYEIRENYVSPIDNQDKIYKDLRPIQILSTEVKKINRNHQKLNKYRITAKYANDFFVNKGF